MQVFYFSSFRESGLIYVFREIQNFSSFTLTFNIILNKNSFGNKFLLEKEGGVNKQRVGNRATQ